MVPKRKSICECNRHSFCRTLNISKYKLPVKYTVSLFGITAFLYNNEKRHSLSSSWRNHEKKHHTFFLMKKQYQETDKSGCISISRKIKEFQQDIWSWITWEKTGLRAGDISPSYPYVAQAGCRCPGAGRGVLQGRCMRWCRACLMLAPAGPNGPTARAWPGPAAKMAAPWGKWFKKGQNAAQRGVQHREHQGQRRRCPKAEQGESLRRPSGGEKPLCTDHNHSLIPPALLWAGKASRSADIEPAKESRKGVSLFVFVPHHPNLF